jgi:hypothetical protein
MFQAHLPVQKPQHDIRFVKTTDFMSDRKINDLQTEFASKRRCIAERILVVGIKDKSEPADLAWGIMEDLAFA